MTADVKKLTELCEARREVQNVIGKYSFDILMKNEEKIPELLWSRREDISLGLNNGAFIGRSEVLRYYSETAENIRRMSELILRAFPELREGKTDSELFGIGSMDYKPMDTGVIEVAEDGQTAKGLWYCRGSYQSLSVSGPRSRWTWGFCAADFVLESDVWKIWHLQYLEDINCVCGESWIEPEAKNDPTDPLFAGIAGIREPVPTRAFALREPYSHRRPFTPTPPIPEPYRTFSETFTYGF